MIKRELGIGNILIFDGDEKYIDKSALLKILNVDGIIRIQKTDFNKLSFPYIHINLEYTGHKVNKRYALMKILRPGYFSEEKEVLPLLELDTAIKTSCTEIENFIKYKDIDNYIEKYNYPKTPKEIKEIILKRYSKSLPNLTKDEILNAGIAFTRLIKKY